MTDVLLYHVTAGNINSTDLEDEQVIPMVNGENAIAAVTDEGVFIDDAAVTGPDIFLSNGEFLHWCSNMYTCGRMSMAVGREQTRATLDTLAMQSHRHCFSFTGVVHIINAVLTPSFLTTTIVDIATANTNTLATLIARAGLEEALSAPEGTLTVSSNGLAMKKHFLLLLFCITHVLPFHLYFRARVLQVFAPSDAAFDALPEGTLQFLGSPPGAETLEAILAYHVVGSVIPSMAIPEGETYLTSLEGSELLVVNNGTSITVNDATVVVPDVLALNGIVHVIDSVLDFLPTAAPTLSPTAAPTPLPNIVDVVVASEDFAILEQAVVQADLVSVLGGDGPFTYVTHGREIL